MSDLLSRTAPGKCLNKVTLAGNLGDVPETRFTPSGTRVTTARLATDETWTDRKGGRRRRTEWHRLVFWRRLAEVASQHLCKGTRVYVEGRLQTRRWEDHHGHRQSVTEIVVTDLRLVDGAGGPGELDLLYGRDEAEEPETTAQPPGALEDDGLPF